MERNQSASLDILKIIAAFTVVTLHVASRYIMDSPIDTLNFKAANFYDSINRYGVPVFVMISGVLFLNTDKENDVKRLWLHSILRIAVIYVVWNYIYYAYQSIFIWNFDFLHQGAVRTVTGIAYASDHLWYLGMLVGLYALSPVVKSYLKHASKQNVEYFLFLFLVFEVLIQTMSIILNSSLVNKLAGTFTVAELTGYMGYFVLGWYLAKHGLPKYLKITVYISLPVDIALNYMISMKLTERAGSYDAGVYDCFGLFTFLEAVAIFVFVFDITKKKKFSRRAVGILRNISKDTLGIYLMHMLPVDWLYRNGYFVKFLPSIIWVLPLSLAIYIACLAVSALLRRIPYVGRYVC